MLCSVGTLRATNEVYDVWDGTTSEIIPSSNKYIVNTAAELAWIAQNNDALNGFAGKTIELAANIDLNGANRQLGWTPIGTAAKPFQGTFNGKNHLIRGMILINAEDGVGLFGHVGTSGKISKTGISGGCIVAVRQRRVGALVGVCAGSVSECWSMAEIAMSGNVGGGLVGELFSGGKLTDTYCCALVHNAGDTVGVLVGRNAGQITRSYTTGYAKNGCAFVGYSADGAKYTKCYYDRKLYYQEPGAVSTGMTGMDEIEKMFKCMSMDITYWKTSDNLYPQLKGFAHTDASRLSVAPVYINTTEKDPINHANDLTVNFRVDIARDSSSHILWNTQELAGAEWIIFTADDENVEVVRPCTETDVIANASFRDEKKTVYFRPRRVDDLKPGQFYNQSGQNYVCLGDRLYFDQAIQNSNNQIYARDGWGLHHYIVVRYGYDATLTGSDKWYAMDTMPELVGDADLSSWYQSSLVCDSTGEFQLRLFVHDERCMSTWMRCSGQVSYTVLPELKPGAITTRWDTLYLNASNKVTLTIPEATAVTGGKAPYSYRWLLSTSPEGDYLTTTTNGSLTYTLEATTKKQRYYRYVTDDAGCDGLSAGVFTVTVFSMFRAGELQQENSSGMDKLLFCNEADAQAHTINATKATGGSGTYQYRWFMKKGSGSPTQISGATNYKLSLSGITFTEGTDYTFYREAKDNTRFTTWTQSGPTQVIFVAAPLNPGAIPTKKDTLILNASNKAVLTITAQTPASGGSGKYTYSWRNSRNGEDIVVTGTNGNLTYTFTGTATYRNFYRHVSDGTSCGEATSDGVYTVTVYPQFKAGNVNPENDEGSDCMSFCTVEDAKKHTITASGESGGSGKYQYKWFIHSGSSTTEIAGATSANLPLSKVTTMSAGNRYTFLRQVKDNTTRTTWTQSGDKQIIHIIRTLDPGEIENEERGRQCLDPENMTAVISVRETAAAAGDGELQYSWWRINGTDSTLVGNERSLNDQWDIDSRNSNITYTYVRYVRQGDCAWYRSRGQVTESYGTKQSGERVHTICESNLPYTMHWTDSQGNDYTHTFQTGGEDDQWIVTDNYISKGCPVDTVITLSLVKLPVISTEETEAKFCQNESEITITYTEVSGEADMFTVTYSDVMAAIMGRSDTSGHIITPGKITLRNVPPLPDKEGKWLDIRFFASGNASDVSDVECKTDMIHVNIESRLGGYLHSKFSRMLFVDNNPNNGEVPAPKLHFKDYRWYKNGNHLTEYDGQQYYHENGQEINGVFYVILTDDNGNTYKSCEIFMPEESYGIVSAMPALYPVPVGAGEPLTINGRTGTAEICSATYEVMLHVECTEQETVVAAPRIPGIYFVRFTDSDGITAVEKLIVK